MRHLTWWSAGSSCKLSAVSLGSAGELLLVVLPFIALLRLLKRLGMT